MQVDAVSSPKGRRNATCRPNQSRDFGFPVRAPDAFVDALEEVAVEDDVLGVLFATVVGSAVAAVGGTVAAGTAVVGTVVVAGRVAVAGTAVGGTVVAAGEIAAAVAGTAAVVVENAAVAVAGTVAVAGSVAVVVVVVVDAVAALAFAVAVGFVHVAVSHFVLASCVAACSASAASETAASAASETAAATALVFPRFHLDLDLHPLGIHGPDTTSEAVAGS